MNHQKIYENLVHNAKLQNRVKLKKDNPNYIYYENHHIQPKCLGGGNEKENLVLLTAREHYIVHKLLIYIFPNNRGISLAFHYMTFTRKNIKLSSRDYKLAREHCNSITISKETREKLSKANKGKPSKKKGIPLSKETRKKLSKVAKGKPRYDLRGRDPWNKGKTGIYSKKTIEKMSLAKLGKLGCVHTEEFKKKVGENNKKYKTGTIHSEETKLKMSKTRKGVKKSPEHIKKIQESRKRFFENKKLLID
jgi:hypothetical protein